MFSIGTIEKTEKKEEVKKVTAPSILVSSPYPQPVPNPLSLLTHPFPSSRRNSVIQPQPQQQPKKQEQQQLQEPSQEEQLRQLREQLQQLQEQLQEQIQTHPMVEDKNNQLSSTVNNERLKDYYLAQFIRLFEETAQSRRRRSERRVAFLNAFKAIFFSDILHRNVLLEAAIGFLDKIFTSRDKKFLDNVDLSNIAKMTLSMNGHVFTENELKFIEDMKRWIRTVKNLPSAVVETLLDGMVMPSAIDNTVSELINVFLNPITQDAWILSEVYESVLVGIVNKFNADLSASTLVRFAELEANRFNKYHQKMIERKYDKDKGASAPKLSLRSSSNNLQVETKAADEVMAIQYLVREGNVIHQDNESIMADNISKEMKRIQTKRDNLPQGTDNSNSEYHQLSIYLFYYSTQIFVHTSLELLRKREVNKVNYQKYMDEKVIARIFPMPLEVLVPLRVSRHTATAFFPGGRHRPRSASSPPQNRVPTEETNKNRNNDTTEGEKKDDAKKLDL